MVAAATMRNHHAVRELTIYNNEDTKTAVHQELEHLDHVNTTTTTTPPGLFLRHLARRSHHICICGRRRFRGDAWTAGVGEEQETTPSQKPLSALVIILEEERSGVKSRLFWKICVPTRTHQRRKSKRELYVRDREEMFHLYNIHSQQ